VWRIEEEKTGRRITVVADDGSEEVFGGLEPRAPRSCRGQEIAAGDALVEGPKDPKELLDIKASARQQYLVEEVQKVYRDQACRVHDKHIELIVRQIVRGCSSRSG